MDIMIQFTVITPAFLNKTRKEGENIWNFSLSQGTYANKGPLKSLETEQSMWWLTSDKAGMCIRLSAIAVKKISLSHSDCEISHNTTYHNYQKNAL